MLIMNRYLTKEINNKDKERIFCFPYAGGGASVFKGWEKFFEGSKIGVYPVQYPGKENRILETPIDNIDRLIIEIFEEIFPVLLQRPFIFFGHSLGTKIAYELSLKVYDELHLWPKLLVVSAGRAPHIREPKPIYYLNDEKFVEELERFEGTPKDILDNTELIKIFLPSLRADFKIDETYERNDRRAVGMDILGFMGSNDKEMNLDELLQWKQYTNKVFSYWIVNGGHLFINTKSDEMCRKIKEYLEKE